MHPSPQPSSIDAEGRLTLPASLRRETRLKLACPPDWVAAGKFQMLDRNTDIAMTHRIARMRTSAATANVKMMVTAYRTHAHSCRVDPQTGTITLPTALQKHLAPLPCTVTLTDRDGPITVSRDR